jgi:hypothetical protein
MELRAHPRHMALRAPARYTELRAPARQLVNSFARNHYADTISTCSYLLEHDTHEATASPHDEGQLILAVSLIGPLCTAH